MSYDHSDVAPYLRAYATSITPVDDMGLPMTETHRLVCWVYYLPPALMSDQDSTPVGQITPKGAGQGFEVSLADGTVLEGDFWTRRTAERALRFAAAGMEVPT